MHDAHWTHLDLPLQAGAPGFEATHGRAVLLLQPSVRRFAAFQLTRQVPHLVLELVDELMMLRRRP